MAQNDAAVALAILDSVGRHTLNTIVCDLAKSGNVDKLRLVRDLKGVECFTRPEGSTLQTHRDPFEVAVKAGQIEVVRELLSFGLKPWAKQSYQLKGSVVFDIGALTEAFDGIIRAKSDEERARSTTLALEVYGAVQDVVPLLFSIRVQGKEPAEVLGEHRHYDAQGKQAPKRVEHESFLDYCIANRIEPLKAAILDYIESDPTAQFSERSAELLVATGDFKNFARLMQYQGEVSSRIMGQVLKLPAEGQVEALKPLADVEVGIEVVDLLAKHTKTLTPSTLQFVLTKCSMELGRDSLSALLVKALQDDNVVLVREVLAMAANSPGWDVNMPMTGRYERSSQIYVHYPVHECRSGEAVRLLIEHGADVEQLDKEGKTPIQALVSNRNFGDSDSGRQLSTLSALVEAGADIAATWGGRTLTQLAAPRPPAVKEILRAAKTQVILGGAVDTQANEATVSRSKGMSPL